MPTYEYACSSCKHEWEFEASMKDPPLTECPACHEATARRQISRGTGFILKGSGWYSDLYSSSSNKEPAKEASSEKGESAAPKGEGAAAKTESSSDKGKGGSGSGDSGAGTSGGTASPAPAATPKGDASTST